jgi:hypothetical protein
LAYGVGFGTNNQYIDKGTYVDLAQVIQHQFRFRQLDSLANRFDKQKVATVYYVQVPAEIRYYSNPAKPAIRLGNLLLVLKWGYYLRVIQNLKTTKHSMALRFMVKHMFKKLATKGSSQAMISL